MSNSFIMANTGENFELLQELSQTFHLGHETMSSVEIEFDDSAECEQVKRELQVRSSQFSPQ